MKASTSRARTRKLNPKLPPLPHIVHSVLGPVSVELVPDLKDEKGATLLGRWLPDSRTIQITKNLTPVAAWHTLFHERAHVSLWDGGVTCLSERDIEHVADVIATAHVAELLGR